MSKGSESDRFGNEKIEIPKILRRQDFRFIPLPKGKKGAFQKKWQKKGGANYTFDDPGLTQYLERGYNYGACGGFGGLTIIDADDELVETAVRENLPETLEVITGRGRHFYYISDLKKGIRLFDPNLLDSNENIGDIKSWGGFAVGPNSIHPNGNRYRIEPKSKQAIADVPADDIIRVARPFTKKFQKEWQKSQEQAPNFGIKITDVVDLKCLTQRNSEEWQGSHPIHGSTTGKNFTVNIKKNVWFCFRCGSGGGPLNFLAMAEGLIRCDEASRLSSEIFKKTLKIAIEKGLISEEELRNWRKKRKDGNRNKSKFFKYNDDGEITGVEWDVVREDIMEEYTFKSLFDTGEVLYYDNGVYRGGGEEIIKMGVEERVGEWGGEYTKKEVIGHIRDLTRVWREEINSRIDLLPVKNGVVSLNTGELIPPDPEIIFTYRLPVRYDKNAECPKITKFLEEVFAGEEDTIPLILEMVGYCLYADGFMPAQSAFWWYGSGANGKDQLATIIENLLGEENISAIDLYELENNRFARGYLYGKLANILGEPNSRKLERSDVYKKATGGTPIDADRKFKGRFKFRNFAKFIIYANKYPEVSDATHAFWRRAVVIKFPNRFEKKKAEDVEIGRKISTPEEMSGFLNLALAALKRLRENNWDFSTTKSMEQTKTEFMMVSNPTGAFLRTRCTKDPTARIATDDLYDAYKDYCEENALTNESKIGFSRKLGEIPGVKGVLVKKDKKRVKGWRGIKVEVREPKNDTDVTDDTDEFSWKKSNEEEESEVDDKIWEYTSVSSGSSVSSSSNVNFDEGFEVYKYIKNRDHELPADGGVGCKEMHKAEKISDIPLERLWNILDKLCRKGKIRMVGGTPGGMRGGGDNFFRAEEG